MNWEVVAPAGTVALVGSETVPPDNMEPSEIAKPPAGAGAVNDTVHVDETNRVIVVGAQVIAESATGRTMVTVAGEAVAVVAEPVVPTADTFKS